MRQLRSRHGGAAVRSVYALRPPQEGPSGTDNGVNGLVVSVQPARRVRIFSAFVAGGGTGEHAEAIKANATECCAEPLKRCLMRPLFRTAYPSSLIFGGCSGQGNEPHTPPTACETERNPGGKAATEVSCACHTVVRAACPERVCVHPHVRATLAATACQNFARNRVPYALARGNVWVQTVDVKK